SDRRRNSLSDFRKPLPLHGLCEYRQSRTIGSANAKIAITRLFNTRAKQVEEITAMPARLIFAVLSCFHWIVILTTSGSAASAPSLIELKAGGFGADAVSSWPVNVAQDRGFFGKEGLQINFTRSYEQMMALIGGNFEVIGEAADAPILAADKGAD